MKTGRTLVEIATELERQRNTRRDFVAPTPSLAMRVAPAPKAGEPIPATPSIELTGLPVGEVAISDYAHSQFAEHLAIPARYYDRMRREDPALLAVNANAWLGRLRTERRMVRTLDGRARAFLSNAYRPLDNFDLADTVLPVLTEKGCEIQSSELTDLRLYIKATLPGMRSEVKGSRTKGDVVEAGIVISNSEVGAGAVKVEPFVLRLVCMNGAIWPDASVKKYHVGRRDSADAVRELLRDETKRLVDAGFWRTVRDVVAAAFDQEVFERIVGRMSLATADKIETTDLEAVVEVTDRSLGLGMSEYNRASVMRHLIEGSDLSRWGLSNAITATANTVEDYELATRLERAGGTVIELPQTDWKSISAARN